MWVFWLVISVFFITFIAMSVVFWFIGDHVVDWTFKEDKQLCSQEDLG